MEITEVANLTVQVNKEDTTRDLASPMDKDSPMLLHRVLVLPESAAVHAWTNPYHALLAT